MIRFFLIGDHPKPTTCLDTVKYWQSKGKEITELVPIKAREISEGSGK